MPSSFFEQPILNSPYEVPTRHHALDKDGQPLEQPPVSGRRRSELITPVPKPRKKPQKSGQTARRADIEFLYDRPYEDRSRVRVDGELIFGTRRGCNGSLKSTTKMSN